MSNRPRLEPLPRAIDAALRELANAMGKSAMYPPGHQMVAASVAALTERIRPVVDEHDALTLGVTPRGLLFDRIPLEPLPFVLRDLAMRLHRRNIGTIYIQRGVTAEELGTMLAAISAPDADERVGREGLRLVHLRVEPLVYDVLGFADEAVDRELDDIFWMHLVEAAFDRRLADGEPLPTPGQIAEAITERAAASVEGARRVYEALAGFSSALAARSERSSGTARKRFVEVLSALSRPTTTRVMAAAPSTASRRRFLRDTVVLVPPALLLQVLESVAEADGEPISPQLRWLLSKLAGGNEEGSAGSTSAFSSQVLGLVEQWDDSGATGVDDDDDDPRVSVEAARILGIGLELGLASDPVLGAARALADRGQLGEALQLLDHPDIAPVAARTVANAVLDPGLLARLLAATPLDFALIERVAVQSGGPAVGPLLDALSSASERGTRRRLLDLLVRIGPANEDAFLAQLPNAPWYLARNIFSVLAQFPSINNVEPVLAALRDDEPRVRQEALKAAVRQPAAKTRAVQEAIEVGDTAMMRLALGSLADGCPPSLIAPVLSVLGHDDDDLRLMAIPLLAGSNNPLIVPQLLALVRTRGGFLRRQRLATKSPVMLAALEVLVARWSNHRPVVPVLQLVARSSDPDVRDVLGGGT